MREPKFAERLLGLAVTSQAASAIVGDLLEQNASPTRFWFTVARILFSLTWRWILGFLLAPLFYFIGVQPVLNSLMRRHDFAPKQPWVIALLYLLVAVMDFSTNTALAVARYGVRDRLTWMSAAVWGTLIGCCSMVWVPGARTTIAVLLPSALAILLLARSTRSLILCVTIPVAAYVATSELLFAIFLATPFHRQSAGMLPHLIFGLATPLFSIIVESFVLARLYSSRPALYRA